MKKKNDSQKKLEPPAENNDKIDSQKKIQPPVAVAYLLI
jgi:hypothetical protein